LGEEKYKYFKPRPDIQQLTRLSLQFYVTIFGHFKGKSQKQLFLKGFGEEKYKYFKPRPDIQRLTRLLLQFYATIFGHFRGKSQKKLF
jgi:hypothetical protein